MNKISISIEISAKNNWAGAVLYSAKFKQSMTNSRYLSYIIGNNPILRLCWEFRNCFLFFTHKDIRLEPRNTAKHSSRTLTNRIAGSVFIWVNDNLETGRESTMKWPKVMVPFPYKHVEVHFSHAEKFNENHAL